MIRRSFLPAGTSLVGIRPTDGRYAVCASADHLDWSAGPPQKEDPPPVKVMDLDDGNVVSQVRLPVRWKDYASEILWLSGSEALCLGYPGGTFEMFRRRFNYLTGKMLQEVKVDGSSENSLSNRIAEAAEDGNTLYSLRFLPYRPILQVESYDLATGRVTNVGQVNFQRHLGGGEGLVPGGRYFYVGGSGFHLYDRRTLKPVYRKDMGLSRSDISFSADGSRYAATVEARLFAKEDAEDDSPPRVLCVWETLTGRMLWAARGLQSWVCTLRMSPDGRRLAVIRGDGMIEVWNLGV
jgi:hypothetical protein